MIKIQRSRENIQITPKTVHPRAVRIHGLFGVTFLRQHMMMDDRWTVDSLTDEFKKMSDLLARRMIFQRMKFNANRKRYSFENSLLRQHCRDGRAKLQMSLYGNTANQIRNTLINHKDMQRLYQKMPIDMVVDGINQRTFVLRKERDRLRFRLKQLKEMYRNKLLERSHLQNRLRYESLSIIDEDTKALEFYKKLKNSNVRLRAIKTINVTFEKMIQVLRHDAIFYEPILRSLSLDINDQANFIKHVLHVGMPALSKFKELNEHYRKMEEKSRKSLQLKLQQIAKHKGRESGIKRVSLGKRLTTDLNANAQKRYVRETMSMVSLKSILENIENVIKTIKFATLCSQAKEIYPRMKSRVDNNIKLKKMIENDMLGHHALESKLERAEVLEGVLINNLTDDEMMRLDRIKSLQTALDFEHQFEKDCLKYMKNRCDAYVLLRCALWNLGDLLRHVGRSVKAPRVSYPNSYLKLPLLKFEMFTMRAYPPEIYEENITALIHGVRRKVTLLVKAYTEVTGEEITKNNNEYHMIFMDGLDMDDFSDANQKQDDEDDLVIEGKMLQNVPNRKQIKSESAKIVEEYSKRDD